MRLKFLILFLGCALAFGQSPEARRAAYASVPAEPPVVRQERVEFNPEFRTALAVSSRYLRDGWCRNKRPVGIGQAEMTEHGGYAGVIGVYDLTDSLQRQWRFQELRVYTGVEQEFADAGEFGRVTIDLGWGYDLYPGNHPEDSGEVSLAFRLDSMAGNDLWNLGSALTTTWNYDYHALLMALTVEHSIRLNRQGDLQWNNTAAVYWGNNRQVEQLTDGMSCRHGMYSVVLTTALQWYVASTWMVEPSLSVAAMPEGNLRRAGRRDEENHSSSLWGMLRISKSF